MIESAEEFIRLRDSVVKHDYDRAALDEAPVEVWREVLDRYPTYGKWVAHNKTVPPEILEVLCDREADVRVFVAMRRRLSPRLFRKLSRDAEAVVRQQIAANKKAPPEILRELAVDPDPDVARVAEFNLNSRR